MIRALVLCFMLSLVASCGFSPVYGNKAATSGVDVKEGLDRVEIAFIPDQSGVYLRNALIDTFYRGGYPASPAYVLTVSRINEVRSDLDITINSEATRRQLRLTTLLSLRDKSTNAEVLQRTLVTVTSYNVLRSQFATRIAENDAREAALNDLARQTETQVSLFFKR